MSSWGSKKAFAISLCLATVPTLVPGNQKTLDVGLFLKVLNKDPNNWLCVNKGWVQATASNHFLPTVHSPAAKSLYNLGCKQWICTSTYKIECVCLLYYNLKYLEVPICRSKLVRSQFSPRKHRDWWPAPAASFDCQIDSVANWCVLQLIFWFCQQMHTALLASLSVVCKMSILIVRPTRCTLFFSLCDERFWSFRAKNMRSPCHLGRSKFLADSPRHLQPLVAAGPWKCLKSFNFGQHKCDQRYYYCMYWRTICTKDCRY